MKSRRNDRGSVLIVATGAVVISVGLAYSAVAIANVRRVEVLHEERGAQAQALADAGVHRAISQIQQTLKLAPFSPFGNLDQLIFLNGLPTTSALATDEALTRNGRTYGTFTVAVTGAATGTTIRDVTITSTGYIPSAQAPLAKATSQAVIRFSLGPSEVFNYSYFINNWGWFYGDTINAYGSVRSNGQFDGGGYASGCFGAPLYDSVSLGDPNHPDLLGYRDDNHDGVKDGTDGGVYAGWDIANVSRIRGIGGQSENQQDYADQVAMPNLSDLSMYESLAKSKGSSIAISNGVGLPPTPVCDSVLGDGPGELQNVVLIGTAANPILLNGPVVVRGDVIIKGVVSGQGSIYSGRNVYVADNVSYLTPPTTLTPTTNSEADTESWIASNASKDFCGLFARENVVMGDFTNGWWRYYVGWWLGDSMNASAEDSGADLIPSTRNGRDGIYGTEDDDALEGDGVFTIEHYTQAQADLGLIPPGKAVGDPIPGTGEDIDGDGAYDSTITLTNFDLSETLNSGKWAGNLPAGTTKFSSLSTIAMTKVQAAMYTNHAAALTTLAWGQPFQIFGSIISRNESMIFGTSTMDMYHDRRILAGGTFGSMLPEVVMPIQVIAWRRLEADVAASVTSP